MPRMRGVRDLDIVNSSVGVIEVKVKVGREKVGRDNWFVVENVGFGIVKRIVFGIRKEAYNDTMLGKDDIYIYFFRTEGRRGF